MQKRTIKFGDYFWMVIIVLLAGSCSKELPSSFQKEEFFKVFGDAYEDEAIDLVSIGEHYYLLGNITTPNQDEGATKDIIIIKVDEYGNRIWEQRIKRPNNLIAADLTPLNDGSGLAYIATYESDDSLYFNDIFFQKITIDGDTMPGKIYHKNYNAKGKCIGQTVAGTFVLVGEHWSTSSTDSVFKYSLITDENGEEIKDGQLNNGIFYPQTVESMLYDEVENNFIVVGRLPGRFGQAGIFRVDSIGTYSNNFNYSIDGYFTDIIEVNDRYFTCGKIIGGKAFVAEINVNLGTYFWLTEIGSSVSDVANKIVVNDDNLCIAGTVQNSNESDMAITIVDFSGTILNEYTVGGEGDETGVFATKLDESFLIFGTTYRNPTSLFALIKTKLDTP